MNARIPWDQELPGWLRCLWWSCCGSGLGAIGGVVWAFCKAAADRTPEWEINEVVNSVTGACVGALIGLGVGLLVALLRRPRRTEASGEA